MANFALDTNTSQGDIISSLNYALANLNTQQITANTIINAVGNVVTVNSATGALQSNNAGTLSYVGGYINVKYANSATGGSGFTSNSTLANYYGVHHTSTGTISTNPADYQWTQVSGGFGTTKALFYTTAGGGQIYFSATTTPPSVNYQPVGDDSPVQLQQLANSIVTTNSIIPGAITTNLLAANLVVARDIVSVNATLGNYASPGYWMQANTGSARFGGSMSIGDSLAIGNNAAIGGNLNIGAGAIIGANASIGGSLVVGSDAQIGGNLTISGLVTAGGLNSNTVQTTTMVPNSATSTYSRTYGARQINNETPGFSGFDGTYYYYQTANLITPSIGFYGNTTTTTVIVSGSLDVYGNTGFSGTFVPQMYAQLFRANGTQVTAVTNSFVTTPAANQFTNGYVTTTQTTLPYRLVEVSIADSFVTVPGTVIQYFWEFGAFINCTSNVAPVQPYYGINDGTLTVTYYKR